MLYGLIFALCAFCSTKFLCSLFRVDRKRGSFGGPSNEDLIVSLTTIATFCIGCGFGIAKLYDGTHLLNRWFN